MEAKTILPQLNLIPIKIGNQTHEFYTDIDVESVRAFIAIWLLENKGTEESDYNLSSLLQYIKKNDPNFRYYQIHHAYQCLPIYQQP